MDPNLTPESSIPPHDAVPNPSHYTGQNDLASQSLAGFLGSIQGSDVNVGPSSHPRHPYTHSHESAHLFIPGYVPNIRHRQGQSYPQPASLPGEGPPSQTHFHTTLVQWDASRWRDENRQMEQAGIVTHNQFTPPQWTHRAPGPSASRGLPSTTIPDTLTSHVQLYIPPVEQASHWTSREHRNEPDVNPGTERADVESVSPEVSTTPSKKRKDMLRKRNQRANDRQYFARICELLEIPLSPKKTLAQRILIGVEELVNQRKLDDSLRRRLEAGEIDLAVLRGGLARDFNDTAPGGSDIGASLRPMGRDADEGHN